MCHHVIGRRIALRSKVVVCRILLSTTRKDIMGNRKKKEKTEREFERCV